MAKFQSPLLGYNNNVRHKGRVFHIQTEDSGVNHPHIITHLFMDGGRILKSVKKSYAEHVGSEGMSEVVRQMMKEQHKAMFIALRDGQFDHIVDPNAAPKPAAAAPAPVPAPAPPAPVPTPAAAPPVEPAPVAAAVHLDQPPNTIDEGKQRPSARPSDPKPQTAAAKIASTPRLVLQVEPDDAPMTTPESRPPVDPPPSVRELTLDFDALERDSQQGPSLFQAMDLPPPPKNLFSKQERGTGQYRAFEADVPPADARVESPPASQRHGAAARASQPAQRMAAAASSGSGPGSAGRTPSAAPARPAAAPSDGRYAPARPAAIFGSTNAAPKPPPQSIFSDELVSDKSLDEVILSYLAEDLEPPRRK